MGASFAVCCHPYFQLLGLVSAFLTFCFALLSHKFENLDGWLQDEHVECVFRADLTDSTD